MSFVIEPGGRLDTAIRRAVHAELTRAVANLTLPPDRLHEGIHEARKSFKRLRALYRLLAAADPRAASVEVARFRAIAVSLAEARDAAALVEAFARLESAFPQETADGALAPVRDFLLHRRHAATHAESGVDVLVASAIAGCREALAAIDVYPLPARRKDAERLLADGIASTLRKARLALRAARKARAPDDFHTLRKRVKDHLYHLGLLRHVWPKPGSPRRAAIDDLGERLGDLNDCDVLMATLAAEAPALAASASGLLALGLLERQAEALRDLVLAEGRRLLRKRPAAVRRSLRKRLRRSRGHSERAAEPGEAGQPEGHPAAGWISCGACVR